MSTAGTPGVSAAASITLRDVRNANRGKKHVDRAFLVRACRPAGVVVAWLLIRLGVSPLQVNAANLAFGVFILGWIAWTGPAGFAAAAVLVLVWQTIDTADGSMARALAIRSNFGGFVDHISGVLLQCFFLAAVGFGLARQADPGMGLRYATIGAAASLLATFYRLTLRTVEVRFGVNVGGEESEELKSGGPLRTLTALLKDAENLGGFHALVFLAVAVAGVAPIYLTTYLGLEILLFAGVCFRLYVSLRFRHEYLG